MSSLSFIEASGRQESEEDRSSWLAETFQYLAKKDTLASQINPERIRGSCEDVLTKKEPQAKSVQDVNVEGNDTSEIENHKLSPEVAAYRQSYESLPVETKGKCTWEQITERLFANDYEKLKLAKAMQGGGQLFGIDAKGRILFRDKGPEPVMYGFDEEGRLLKIYDRNPEQMDKVEKWADYFEIREQVFKEGYELFTDDGNYNLSDEMRQAIYHSGTIYGQEFVASKGGKEGRGSWLESGGKPGRRLAIDSPVRLAIVASYFPFKYDGGLPILHDNNVESEDGFGAVRLLRV